MITKHYSLVQAEVVLHLLLNDERAEKYDHVVECYQNGREHGFQILVSGVGVTQAITWAQYRTSDHLVVYHGDYSMQSISDSAWEQSRSFGFGKYQDAVDYIFKLIEDEASLAEDALNGRR